MFNFIDKWETLYWPEIKKAKFNDPRSKLYSFKGTFAKYKHNYWLKAFCTHGDNVINTAKQRWKFMGVAGKVSIYNFFSENCGIKLLREDFNFKDTPIYDLLTWTSKFGNYKRFGFPLPISKECRFMGVYRGSVPFKIDKKQYGLNTVAYDVLQDVFPVGKEHMACIYPGSYPYASENLHIMATEPGGKYTFLEMFEGVYARRMIDFKIPRISWWKIDVLNGILINPKAFPGIMTAKIMGSKRVYTTGFMKQYAIEYFNNVILRYNNVIDDSFCTVGGREKRVMASESYKILKTRVVIMMEDLPTLLGQSVAVPVTRAFQRLNEGFSFVGRSLEERNYVSVSKELECDCINDICFSADFSSHDNYVSRNQIIFAFSILRLVFPSKWKFMDKLFLFNCSSMINKNIIVPKSNFVYKVTKGIATGHPFTSLVNTICAYTVFAVAMHKVCTPDELLRTRLFVAGDDVIGKVPIDVLKKLSHELTYNSGMKINLLEDNSYPLYSSNPDYGVSFLKKRFTLVGMAWNFNELCVNLLHNGKGHVNTLTEIDRIINMCMNGPCDFSINRIIHKLIDRNLRDPTTDLHKSGIPSTVPLSCYLEDPDYSNLKNKLSAKSLINTDSTRSFFKKKFANFMKLGFRWFNVGQPFPALGAKDDSYWIDATKRFIPPTNRPFKYLLSGFLREQHSLEW